MGAEGGRSPLVSFEPPIDPIEILSPSFSLSCQNFRDTVSDEHNKPFCKEAITIINNFKQALGDTDIIDKFQFFKAISINYRR